MRRTVRVTLKFEMVLDDEHSSIPFVKNPADAVLSGFKGTRGLVEIKPGARLAMSLDRASYNEVRRAREAYRAAKR